MGNDVADPLAKTAALRHPRPSPEEIERLSKLLLVSRLVCDLAGPPPSAGPLRIKWRPFGDAGRSVVAHQSSWQGRFSGSVGVVSVRPGQAESFLLVVVEAALGSESVVMAGAAPSSS
eukprot:583870-Pyramimonas_sp.AAC.1